MVSFTALTRVFLLVLGCSVATSLHAGTIEFEVTDLGGTDYRYTYYLSGFSLNQNQEVDIRFDPALYGTLSNGVAGAGFDLVLFQPDNPTQLFGDYSALATIPQPPLTGPFSVDVVFNGVGLPGSQPFFINTYDDNLNFVSTDEEGFTIPRGAVDIPEPATGMLAAVALLLGCFLRVVRRRAGAAIGQ